MLYLEFFSFFSYFSSCNIWTFCTYTVIFYNNTLLHDKNIIYVNLINILQNLNIVST